VQAEQIVWDQALIEKYNYSGPRYTSYPTALEFNEGFGYPDFVQAAGQYPARNTRPINTSITSSRRSRHRPPCSRTGW